jgi:hypothetical protein
MPPRFLICVAMDRSPGIQGSVMAIDGVAFGLEVLVPVASH